MSVLSPYIQRKLEQGGLKVDLETIEAVVGVVLSEIWWEAVQKSPAYKAKGDYLRAGVISAYATQAIALDKDV